MSDEYTIRQNHPHGIAVIGSIPVTDAVDLMKIWGKRGYKLMDFAIAERLGASVVVVKDKAAGEAWRTQLGMRIDNPNWLLSGDTGISSMTIYAVLNDGAKGGRDMGIPHDPDDFGRCYRLMRRHPEWRERMGEVVAACPAWKPIVEHWDELVGLFESEGKLDEHGRPTVGRMPMFYDRIQFLQK